MPRLTVSEEVQILRFFEQAPYDKAETLLHIVCEKMRERKPAAMCEEPQAGGGKIKRRARASPHTVPDTAEATGTLDG
jgi:hypothetical protein